jgi:class 3 adenylate cyclase/tetratricopeptide (TPR) repeat protein
MDCASCQSEIPQGAKFCVECGNKLEVLCPQCKFSNSPSYKFCSECGCQLIKQSKPAIKELSFDEKLDKIQRYLPKGLSEKILAQKGRIEGERKQVTVMFCDMENFVHFSEKLGSEDAYAIMDRVYEILIHKVHEYEGTVNEMTGDGIMALFGAPIALEDAPQRAVRTSLAIHREIEKLNDDLINEKRNIDPVRMRIGINTGPVVLGTLGNDLRVEFKVVGDTVNLASRMEGLAEPGATYVTVDTFKLTEGFFRFEALGEKGVKGKEGPIHVYRVIAPGIRRTRFDVSAERGLTPFIGREREVDILKDAFERVKTGKGQSISIISEAGVGKSRLLYEFRKAIANEDSIFWEGKCLSFSKGVAYHPVTDILKSNFNVLEGEADPAIRKKISDGLKVLGVEESATLPYLLELLSVKDSGIDKIMMSPEGRKDRIIEALKRVVLKSSELRPLVMAFEDLHWMDKSSEEALKYVLESIPGSKILLLLTYRPEFVHTWGAKSYHSQITLNRLSNRESLKMVSHLLGTEDLDENIAELILEKTEGVPFFIEEFIRSFIELKILESDGSKYRLKKGMETINVPSTIQDVIMARVDSLSEGAKEVLQIGSVIEREFSYQLIKNMTDLPEQELLSYLSSSKDLELLYERGIYPQSTYIFKHALTQEVVYQSILTKKRKKLHGEIGKAIENLYKKSLDEHYGVLAEHFLESENYEKAANCSKLAARSAEKMASLNDAVSFAKKAVASLENLPPTNDTERKLIDARTVLGLYLAQLNHFVDARKSIDPIFDLAIKHDYKKRLAQIYLLAGIYDSFVVENYSEGIKQLENGLNIAEEVNDIVSFVLGNYWLGTIFSCNCEFEKAYHHLEKAIEINVAANNLWGVSGMKGTLSMVLYWHGKIDLAYKTSREAKPIAEKSDDIYSKALAYTHHGISCYGKHLLEESLEFLIKGAIFCERINYHLLDAIAKFNMAEAYFDTGKYQKSLNYYNEVISILKVCKTMPSLLSLSRIGVARVKAVNKKKDINIESLYNYHRTNRMKLLDGWMSRYIGEILLNLDEQKMSEANHWIENAIEADTANEMMLNLGKDHALYAELLKRKGDRLEAREKLGKAIDILKECGAKGWVEKYEKELTKL